MDVRKRIRFHGRVQHVGFRYTAMYYAKNLGLSGWVSNEEDGTVLMEVQGREQQVYRLLEAINNREYIQISWMDTEDIPIRVSGKFYVKQ